MNKNIKHKATYLCHGEHYENFSYYFAIKQIARICKEITNKTTTKLFTEEKNKTFHNNFQQKSYNCE